jgi:hypothetical protein
MNLSAEWMLRIDTSDGINPSRVFSQPIWSGMDLDMKIWGSSEDPQRAQDVIRQRIWYATVHLKFL